MVNDVVAKRVNGEKLHLALDETLPEKLADLQMKFRRNVSESFKI